jgi:hypothetical protein
LGHWGALAKVGLAVGTKLQYKWDAPKAGELLVRMNRNDLEDIAWLADFGLPVWIMPATMASGMADNGPRTRRNKCQMH